MGKRMKWWECECWELDQLETHASIHGNTVDIYIMCLNCGSSYEGEIPREVLIKFPGQIKEENTE